mmetsp:Transcript_8923/g.31656  ORF Transcript_8923/g.31656 Transcript_8923/m.31656 type:complete len:113 (-) Transcript_8923:1416-1754(-)
MQWFMVRPPRYTKQKMYICAPAGGESLYNRTMPCKNQQSPFKERRRVHLESEQNLRNHPESLCSPPKAALTDWWATMLAFRRKSSPSVLIAVLGIRAPTGCESVPSHHLYPQ